MDELLIAGKLFPDDQHLLIWRNTSGKKTRLCQPMLTPDDLLRLVPDRRILEGARRLFFADRWTDPAGDGHWLWAEWPTRPGARKDAKPLRAAVRLDPPGFFCTCRAPTRPCVHATSLVLLFKNRPDRLRVSEPPDWVRETAERSRKRETAAPNNPPSAAMELAPTRRAAISAGVEELAARLRDTLRRGLAETMAAGTDFWEDTAARLVDNKLPGPARALRRMAMNLADLDSPPADPAAYLLDELGRLELFCRTWQQFDRLPPAQRQTWLRAAGHSPKRAEVLAGPALEDHWLVLGVTEGREEQLSFRRAWVRGERTGKYALLLDYSFGGAAYPDNFPLGSAWLGRLHYYPGSRPQRGILVDARPSGRVYEGLRATTDLTEVAATWQTARAQDPWTRRLPVYLTGMRVLRSPAGFVLYDAADRCMPLTGSEETGWALLATGGGAPLSLFGEYDGSGLLVLSRPGADGRLVNG